MLGPNGVGKSTLLKALLGLVPLRAGEIRVLGRPRGARPARDRLPAAAPQLRPGLRIRGVDIVRLGLDGDRWGVPLPWRTRGAPRARDSGSTSSSSSSARRRTRTARSASAPAASSSGCSSRRRSRAGRRCCCSTSRSTASTCRTRPASRRSIERICREQGVTVLIVAHDVNPILGFLDRVVYFAGGGAACGDAARRDHDARR